MGFPHFEKPGILCRKGGLEGVALLQKRPHIVIGAGGVDDGLDLDLVACAEVATIFDLTEAGAVGCISGFQITEEELFAGGILHIQPIPSPSGFTPTPLRAVFPVSDEHATVVSDDAVGLGVVHI